MSALQDDKPIFEVIKKGKKKKTAAANDAPIRQEEELGEGEVRLQADDSFVPHEPDDD